MTDIALQVAITFAGVPEHKTLEFQRACDPLAGYVASRRDHAGVVVELERTVRFEGCSPSIEQLYDSAVAWRARAQAVADAYGVVMHWGGVRHRVLAPAARKAA